MSPSAQLLNVLLQALHGTDSESEEEIEGEDYPPEGVNCTKGENCRCTRVVTNQRYMVVKTKLHEMGISTDGDPKESFERATRLFENSKSSLQKTPGE